MVTVTVTVTVNVAEPLKAQPAGARGKDFVVLPSTPAAPAGCAVGVLSVQYTVYRAMEDRVGGRDAEGARRKTGKARSVLYLTDWCYQRYRRIRRKLQGERTAHSLYPLLPLFANLHPAAPLPSGGRREREERGGKQGRGRERGKELEREREGGREKEKLGWEEIEVFFRYNATQKSRNELVQWGGARMEPIVCLPFVSNKSLRGELGAWTSVGYHRLYPAEYYPHSVLESNKLRLTNFRPSSTPLHLPPALLRYGCYMLQCINTQALTAPSFRPRMIRREGFHGFSPF